MSSFTFFLNTLIATAPYAMFPWLYAMRTEINACISYAMYQVGINFIANGIAES